MADEIYFIEINDLEWSRLCESRDQYSQLMNTLSRDMPVEIHPQDMDELKEIHHEIKIRAEFAGFEVEFKKIGGILYARRRPGVDESPW